MSGKGFLGGCVGHATSTTHLLEEPPDGGARLVDRRNHHQALCSGDGGWTTTKKRQSESNLVKQACACTTYTRMHASTAQSHHSSINQPAFFFPPIQAPACPHTAPQHPLHFFTRLLRKGLEEAHHHQGEDNKHQQTSKPPTTTAPCTQFTSPAFCVKALRRRITTRAA